jgi:hypothetical protein
VRTDPKGRHDFYVEQVKAKVLSQFGDIESEAERYGNAEYDRLGELPGDEDSDMAEIAEEAMARAQNFYGLLSDLKKQMILGALAGMYHQWEKDLREFIERELRHNYAPETVAKVAWGANIADVFKVLSDFGWNYSACHFFSRIDACRLIVNVYKHGKGQSLEELARRYPEYLNVPLAFESFFCINGSQLSPDGNGRRVAFNAPDGAEIKSNTNQARSPPNECRARKARDAED